MYTPVSGLEINGNFVTSGDSSGGTSMRVLTLDETTRMFTTKTVTIGDETWAVINSNYTAAARDCLACDTSGGQFTVTLPTAPAANTTVAITAYNSSFAEFPLIVHSPDSLIVGLGEDFYCDLDNLSIRFVYIDTTVGWRII